MIKARPALAVVALLAAACCSLGGCLQLFGWTVALFAPPKKVEAKYKFPKDRTVLVLVDDIRDPVGFQRARQPLTRALNAQLEEHGIAERTLPYARVLELMGSHPDYYSWEPRRTGRRLGADIVLHVKIEAFSLKDHEDSPLWRGQMGATVKVVGVEEGLLWPQDRPGGHPVGRVETEEVDNPSPQYAQKVTEGLCEALADRIAKLFYKHKAPRAGTLSDRSPAGR